MTARHLIVVTLLAALLAPAAVGSAAPLTLVEAGQSRYEIVVSTTALPITRRAADELRQFIAASTGVTLPLRQADALGDKPAIVVGDGELARAAGIDVNAIAPEGFRLLTKGEHLYIVGRDTAGDANSDHWRSAPQAGTWHGVSTFLQDHLGIRWFFPGQTGQFVPHHDKLVIDALDVQQAPAMQYRRMSYLWEKSNTPQRRREVIDWQRRNRLGWSVVWQASHVWTEHFRGEDYFKEHPEWFALVDGRRLGYAPYGLQMCTTNAGALDQFARNLNEQGKQFPGVMLSLSPNDGGNHCQCDTCRALDVEKFPDGHPVLTDRYVTYCNEVARRVRAVHPEQTFGFYAYSYYLLPPRRTKLDPSVYVMSVYNDTGLFYYVPELRRRHLQEVLLPWKQAVGQLYFYGTPEGMGNLDLPAMNQQGIKALFADLYAAGVSGFSMNNTSSFASTGLNNYLYAQLAWNSQADADVFYADALARCYGEAAPKVRAYFDLVESRLGSFAAAAVKLDNRALGAVRRFPDIMESCYVGLAQEAAPLLHSALQAATDPGQRARVQMLIDHLHYTDMTQRLYELSKVARNPATASATLLAEAAELAARRRAWMSQHDGGDQIVVSRVMRTEVDGYLAFDPKVYEYLLAATTRPPVAEATLRQTPAIDGDLSDSAWQAAPHHNASLNKDDAAPRDVQTTFQIARDEKFLYLAVRCAEPMMAKVADSVTQRDGNVWAENEIEIFIDVGNTRQDFFQMCINTLGTTFDTAMRGGKDVPWDPDVRTATAKTDDGWTLELALPLDSLSSSPVRPGDVWGFNLCRVRTVVKPQQYTCWAPTFGGFRQPARFGKLIFP